MNDDPLAKLQFRLLGPPQIQRNGVLCPGLTAAKAQALLYYFAMTAASGRTTHTRMALASLLWGECGDSEARGNLRKVIQQLREQLAPYLLIDNQSIGFRSPDRYTVDAVEFAKAMAHPRTAPADRLQAAIALYTGDFLEGFYVREAPDFEAWMLAERARLRELLLQGVETLALRYADQGDLPQAIATARHLLELEPWREETHRQLMSWLAQNGQRSAALAQYEICQRALAEELAVEPSQATRELYARLQRQDAPEPQTAQSRSATVEYTLVGRQREWQALRTAWRQVQQSGTHFVCIAGEAGIGKTRLAEELLIDVQRQGYTGTRTRCYALEGRLAYGPVAAWLRNEPLRLMLTKLNNVWRSEIARLLPELLVEQPDLPPPQPLTARWQQKQLFEALVQAFTSNQRPLLLLLDDLQWCDPETLEWLHYLLQAAPQAPLLVVGTMRNDEMDEDHPLYQLGRPLLREGKLTILELAPLSAEETVALGAQVANQGLDSATSQRLYRETAGNPLFVVECMRAGLPTQDKGPRRQEAQAEAFVVAELPPKVQSVIQTRLAQLSPAAHGVAHLAAAVGRPCAVDLLVQASQQDEESVVRAIEELWRRRLLREQEPGFYDFSHDRLRDVAYAELSPMRRRLYHRRIAQALEQIYAATLDRMSGQVATQYELADMPEQAVPYYQQAAATARHLYANREVIHYLQKGLALLRDLPSTPVYRQQALKMQVELAAALFDIEGWASLAAEQAYARAFELCQQAEKTEHLFPILWGLHEVYLFQAKYDQARTLAEQCMAIAERVQDPALLLEAHHAMWSVLDLLSPSEIELARMHAEQGIALYNPQQHHALTPLYGGHDPGVCGLNFAAGTLWQLGYPDQAQRRGQEAIRLGYQLGHPFSLALALVNGAALHVYRREIDVVLELMTKAMPIAAQWEMPPLLAQGRITLGWAQVMQGNIEQGLAELHQGLAEWRSMRIVLRQAFYLLLLSEAYAKAGQIEAALRTLDEAQAAAAATGERFEESEIHRLRGELSFVAGKGEEAAEAAFHQALQLARQQKMRILELRAAVSLSRLWQQQGKVGEARELLSAIYHWFTEGFDTVDLREAKALLDELQTC